MMSRRVFAGFSLALAFTVTAGLPDQPAEAREKQLRRPQREAVVPEEPVRKPYLAVVGLQDQRVIFYDGAGAKTLESKISSGSTGYETPPGIFSVVQKNYDHYSNVYDDASMPFMQRLTWTGIALHAGVLPGYPASHGCVRLPHEFARDLFDRTDIGMRVVIARQGIAPVAFPEPAMFKKNASPIVSAQPSEAIQLVNVSPETEPSTGVDVLDRVRDRFETAKLAAEEAAQRSKDQRGVATRAKSEAQPAKRALEQAQAALASAQASQAAAEKVIASNPPPKRLAQAQKDLTEAAARIEAARTKLEKVRSETRAKIESARVAEEKLTALVQDEALAKYQAEQAKLDLSPVSVFVSRATRRIYVRKAFHPVMEAPILIRDADKPIGTFVFTAGEPAEGQRDLRWNVVSLYKNPTNIEPFTPPAKSAKQTAAPAALLSTDPRAAEAALARLDVPQDVAALISQIVLPGSSLIISDEPPSVETGKDTDFIVLMSGEPNGGIISRKRTPKRQEFQDDGWFWGSSSASAVKPGKKKPTGGVKFLWFN